MWVNARGALLQVLNHTPAIVDLVFRYANNSLAQWAGYAPAEMIGMTLWQIYGEEVVNCYLHCIKRALAGVLVIRAGFLAGVR